MRKQELLIKNDFYDNVGPDCSKLTMTTVNELICFQINCM